MSSQTDSASALDMVAESISASVQTHAASRRTGGALARAFTETLSVFMAEHLVPAARRAPTRGQAAVEILSELCALLRAAADGIECGIERGEHPETAS